MEPLPQAPPILPDGPRAGIREGAADSLISPGRDRPAVEGSIFTGPAGFWVVGEACGFSGELEHSVPLQPLVSGVLPFAGAAAGPVGAVLPDAKIEAVGSHGHDQEHDHLQEKADERTALEQSGCSLPSCSLRAPPGPPPPPQPQPQPWSQASLHPQRHLGTCAAPSHSPGSCLMRLTQLQCRAG